MFLTAMLGTILSTPTAAAAPVEVWSYSDFRDNTWVAGSDGWVGGYEQDPWFGYTGSTGTKWAMAYTDDNTGDAGGNWGSGGAVDNFLVNDAEDVGDGRFVATFYTADDDALALVIGQRDASNYYMFMLCGDEEGNNPSCPISLDGRAGSAIIKISSGSATVLASSRSSYTLDRDGAYGEISLELNDGVLTATYADAGISLTVADASFSTVNAVGFYAYDSGYEDGTWTGFANPVLYAMDDDNDGVIDDDDNCENTSNRDQADSDGDGIGDACDDPVDPEGDADTDADSDTDTDTDSDTDTDTDTDTDPGDKHDDGAGLSAVGECGCDTGGGGAGLLSLALAALATRRRRRG